MVSFFLTFLLVDPPNQFGHKKDVSLHSCLEKGVLVTKFSEHFEKVHVRDLLVIISIIHVKSKLIQEILILHDLLQLLSIFL